MVGVAGRSKACLTCRRRRKGCDYKRPTCGHCQRLGLKCEGYERSTVFIQTDPAAASGTKVLSFSKKKPSLSTKSITLPSALASSAYKDKYLGIFWDIYLPGYSSQAISLTKEGSISTVNWIIDLQGQNIYHQSPFLEKALMAVCLGTLGRRLGDRAMIEEGMKAYSAATGSMCAILKRIGPKQPPDDAMLAATRCLGMYEVFHGTDFTDESAQALAWHRHQFGELALLSARTPEQQMEGIAHQMFTDGRLCCTIASLATRKGLILSRPEWKIIPWSKNAKTPIDMLLDIFVDVPGLLESLDMVEAAHISNLPNRKELQADLLERCATSLQDLSSWLQKYAPDWDWKAHLDGRTPTPADIAAAYNMCLYWAIEIKVRATAIDAALLPHVTSSENIDLQRQQQQRRGLFADLLPQMEAIIQTAPIFFTPAAGIAGCQIAVFPLVMSSKLLNAVASDSAREMQGEIIKLLAKSKELGLEVSNFVDSLAACYKCHYCPYC